MTDFEKKLNGALYGLLRWSDWDALRQRLKSEPDRRWFAYAMGTERPTAPLAPEALDRVIHEIDKVLRRDHDEGYLGVVYANDPSAPSLIKIYDPNHLGAACGTISYKVPPGWVLSTDAPSAATLPANRRRWWAALHERFGAPQ